MNEKIQKLKFCFKEQSEMIMKKDPSLKAVFCTGSIANNRNVPDSSYQDFDIHFYYDKEYLTKEDLEMIKGAFDECARQIESEEVAVDYSVSDKPWKMVPRKRINIGMHGTVLNSFDYQKRIGPNYILAANMFTCSEVLIGNLPLPPHEITNEEFLSNAGGMGWLEENFYRLLPVLNPNLPDCAPAIREISIYFGLTPLLHYYYQNNKGPATRKTAKEYFMGDSRVPQNIKNDVERIYKAKNRDISTVNESFNLLNAAYNIIKYVTNYLAKDLPHYKFETPDNEDDYSEIVSKVLNRNVALNGSWLLLDGDNFKTDYERIVNNVPANTAYFPDDFVECVLFAITHQEINDISRMHIFDEDSYRICDKTDFGPLTMNSSLYGWEKSISTYIQRLNEYYISGKESRETYDKLAEILLKCAISDYKKLQTVYCELPDLVLNGKNSSKDNWNFYFACLHNLAKMGHVLKISKKLELKNENQEYFEIPTKILKKINK